MKHAKFDVYDEHNQPLNYIADFEEVFKKGLWHRGAHAIIYTPEREILMQMRAKTLIYHPGLLEIGGGGGVDAGETPEQAVIREVKEEFGLSIKKSELEYIGVTKYNHRTKFLVNHGFIYSYAVCLPKDRLKITIDAEETSSAFLISERKLKRALKTHRIKNVGRISPEYAYWKFLLDAIA